VKEKNKKSKNSDSKNEDSKILFSMSDQKDFHVTDQGQKSITWSDFFFLSLEKKFFLSPFFQHLTPECVTDNRRL